jgi:succinylglutamate desuccinylase
VPTLTEFEKLPAGLLEVSAKDLHKVLPGPSLVHIQGAAGNTLFVSVLLHGNEDAGLKTIQRLLKKWAGSLLPRPLSIFFGNIEAARHQVRFLDTQPDFNRIWGNGDGSHIEYRELSRCVTAAMSYRGLFAALDLHNNTGRNPLYTCVRSGDIRSQKLAYLFSSIAVSTDNVVGTLASAFSTFCPAITCECGEIGNEQGVNRAVALLERCLQITEQELDQLDHQQLNMYESYATIKVPQGVSISISREHAFHADISFSPDIDLLNFRTLPTGFSLARIRRNLGSAPLLAIDNNGVKMPGIFETHDDQIRLVGSGIPAMLTPSEDAIRKTCLGYLVRRTSPRPGLANTQSHTSSLRDFAHD